MYITCQMNRRVLRKIFFLYSSSSANTEYCTRWEKMKKALQCQTKIQGISITQMQAEVRIITHLVEMRRKNYT